MTFLCGYEDMRAFTMISALSGLRRAGGGVHNKEQYSSRLCACLPKDQNLCSALWPFRLMPLPPLPPAGNMTHLHGYKVRLDLGW